MGCVEALVGCPLSHGCRRASVSAAASDGRWATSHRDVAAPEGGAKSRLPPWGRCHPKEGGEGKVPAAPSHGLCGSAGGRPSQSPNGDSSPKGGAKSRLPLWGRWTRVSEDGEGKLPAAPSHGLCRSAGGLPSQSPSGDSSPEGRAKSRLPPWGRCHPKEGGEGKALPSGKNASLFP